MVFFKNKVGRPSNKQLLKRKILISIVTILFVLAITFFGMVMSSLYSKKLKATPIVEDCTMPAHYKDQSIYVKSDTILRDNASQSANIVDIISKGTEVKYSKCVKNKSSAGITYYYEIEYGSKKGFVLRRQLTSKSVKSNSKTTLTKKEKLKLVLNAEEIYKLGKKSKNIEIGYSKKSRNSGYYYYLSQKKGRTDINDVKSGFCRNSNGKEIKNKYCFDCSSFVNTIIDSTFGTKYRTTKGNLLVTESYLNRTKDMYSNGKKYPKLFNIIQTIKKGDIVNIEELQIGDIILGFDDRTLSFPNFPNNSPGKPTELGNHVMLYVGDGYIIHATSSPELGIGYGRNGVVRERIQSLYYRKLAEGDDLNRRFNKVIYILRYNK